MFCVGLDFQRVLYYRTSFRKTSSHSKELFLGGCIKELDGCALGVHGDLVGRQPWLSNHPQRGDGRYEQVQGKALRLGGRAPIESSQGRSMWIALDVFKLSFKEIKNRSSHFTPG